MRNVILDVVEPNINQIMKITNDNKSYFSKNHIL